MKRCGLRHVVVLMIFAVSAVGCDREPDAAGTSASGAAGVERSSAEDTGNRQYASMTAKQLATHINEHLMPGVSGQAAGSWKDLHRHILNDDYQLARVILNKDEYLLSHVSGERKEALLALKGKIND